MILRVVWYNLHMYVGQELATVSCWLSDRSFQGDHTWQVTMFHYSLPCVTLLTLWGDIVIGRVCWPVIWFVNISVASLDSCERYSWGGGEAGVIQLKLCTGRVGAHRAQSFLFNFYEDATGTAAVSVVSYSYTTGTAGVVLHWPTGFFSL